MTLRKDAESAHRAAVLAEAALVADGAWTGSPLFERDRGEALSAVRRIMAAALEVIGGTGDEP